MSFNIKGNFSLFYSLYSSETLEKLRVLGGTESKKRNNRYY